MAELKVTEPHLYIPGVDRETGRVRCEQCGRPFGEHSKGASECPPEHKPILLNLRGLSDDIALRVAIAQLESMAREMESSINLEALWKAANRREAGLEKNWEADCGLVLAAMNFLNQYRRGAELRVQRVDLARG